MNSGVEKLDSASGFRFLQFKCNRNDITDLPAIIYLHGAGEYGHDIQSVCKYGLPSLIKNHKLRPNCDVICPQMEKDTQWDCNQLHDFISSLKTHDHEIILVGFSPDGEAVCNYVARYGASVGLAIVISGRGQKKLLYHLRPLNWYQ